MAALSDDVVISTVDTTRTYFGQSVITDRQGNRYRRLPRKPRAGELMLTWGESIVRTEFDHGPDSVWVSCALEPLSCEA